jgi:hypothetical protein
MKSFKQYIFEENWKDQKFGDGKNEYSVAKIVNWAKKNGEYVECLPIKDTDGLEWWKKSYGDKNGNPKSEKEKEKLEKADLSYPILGIKYDDKVSVADGLHRIKKASMMGKKCVAAYLIDKEDLLEIQNAKVEITEAPEIDPYIEGGDTIQEPFDVPYLKKMKNRFHSADFVGHRKMGRIHPQYELWRHTYENTDQDGSKYHQHHFSIVHTKTREKVGEIDAIGGKINRKTGEHRTGTGKDLKIVYLGIHHHHSAKRVGGSLAVAAYKQLHRRGHSIKSDTRQSLGGAGVWDTLRKDKDVGHHVMVHDERDNKRIPAHKLSYDAIWQDNPSGQESTLVLHAKPKKVNT